MIYMKIVQILIKNLNSEVLVHLKNIEGPDWYVKSNIVKIKNKQGVGGL